MKIFLFVLAILACFLPQIGAAEVPFRQPYAVWYKVRWAGFNVADMVAEVRTDKQGKTYVESAIRTYGLAKVVSGYGSDNNARFRIHDTKVMPEFFETHFTFRNRKRDIEINYDKAGAFKSETNIPPENRGKRPAVPAKLKAKALDPISAIIYAHLQLKAGKKNLVIPVYDGRRRFNAVVKIAGKENGLIKLNYTEEMVAGFTGNEKKQRDEIKATIDFYIDAKTYLPVRAVGTSYLGTAFIETGAVCKNFEECLNKATPLGAAEPPARPR